MSNDTKKHLGGWIGVDFDGTLAEYHGWKGDLEFGPPIPAMVERVKCWHDEGIEVRIFTARYAPLPGEHEAVGIVRRAAVRAAIVAWCKYHLGFALGVTHEKDLKMFQLWDDRAVCVERNTGRVLGTPNDIAESDVADVLKGRDLSHRE